MPQEGAEKAEEAQQRQAQDTATIQHKVEQVAALPPSPTFLRTRWCFGPFPRTWSHTLLAHFLTRRGCVYNVQVKTADSSLAELGGRLVQANQVPTRAP